MITIDRNSAFIYLGAAIASWIVFFGSTLILTEGIMYFMAFDMISAISFLFIGFVVLSLNIGIFKVVFSRVENGLPSKQYPVQNFHYLTRGLRRIFWTIVVLVSLGLITSLSTFLFASMDYYTTHDISSLIKFIPFLLGIYLLFIIPSLFGIKEVARLNKFFQQYQVLKFDLGEQLESEF